MINHTCGSFPTRRILGHSNARVARRADLPAPKQPIPPDGLFRGYPELALAPGASASTLARIFSGWSRRVFGRVPVDHPRPSRRGPAVHAHRIQDQTQLAAAAAAPTDARAIPDRKPGRDLQGISPHPRFRSVAALGMDNVLSVDWPYESNGRGRVPEAPAARSARHGQGHIWNAERVLRL